MPGECSRCGCFHFRNPGGFCIGGDRQPYKQAVLSTASCSGMALDYARICAMEEQGEKSREAALRSRQEAMAGSAVNLVREQLLSRMPYLDRALVRMPLEFYRPEEIDEHTIGFGTDGEKLFAVPEVILSAFEVPGLLEHMELHSLLHCLYCHLFRYGELDRDAWDLAADLAVEQVILHLQPQPVRLAEDPARLQALDLLHEKVPVLNAESIYGAFRSDSQLLAMMKQKADLFRMDLHVFWLPDNIEGKQYPFRDRVRGYPARPKVSHRWQQMEQAVEIEIEGFEKTMGYTPGTILKAFRTAGIHHEDYAEFLRKFASRREEMRVSQEEFDEIYYTYGMRLYGNLPLIEPLETSEESRIHDFVIALDTSGSCQGRVVRDFLIKTYDLLKSADSFFARMNVHIIQCDARIQKDVRIASQAEFDAYMKEVELAGFGGTDFRPVFDYVEKLKQDGEFEDLRGLLYLTDGRGVYPAQAPSFQTAFIFLEDGFEKPQVPPWAIRLTLAREQLQ